MIGGVALLAEGVDRNLFAVTVALVINPSPSSRRAWIEMPKTYSAYTLLGCRPPRGGRG